MGILIHPLTALVVCIVLGAIAVSGKFSQHAANVFLFIAAVVGGIGIVRSGLKDPRLITMFVCGLIIVVCGVSYWVKPHAKDSAQNVPPPAPPVSSTTNNAAPPVKEAAPTHKTAPAQHAAEHPALSFQAFWVGIGNLPERSKVTNTWDGKPWDEHDYADVRLTITNGLDLALQNVDLDINVATEEPTGIAGIGQLTNINGIEFRKPALNIREPTLQLQDKSDGKWYNLPLSPFFDEHRIVPDYRIFCPRLAQRDIIRLILATIHLEQRGKPPKKLRITGSYVTESGQGRTTGQVNEVVIVAQ